MSTAARSTPRDPALGLLDRLVRDALDQGYVDAAARRQGSPPAETSFLRRHAVGVLGLVLVVAVLTVGVVDQVVGAPDAAERKRDLAAAIDDSTAQVDALEGQVRSTSGEVDRLRAEALGSGAEGQDLRERLAGSSPAVGTAAVTGPGVVVSLDDAPADDPSGTGSDPELGRVLDRDLQLVVNGLWAAGAEAVAVNDQRLTSLTAIRGAGGAILVNYRPLVRPYTVTAIGDPDTLQARFSAGPAGVQLEALRQTYGLRYDVSGSDQVTLPGEPGAMLREARAVQP